MTPRRTKTIDLDDPGSYAALDSDGMLERIHEFPAQLQIAWDRAMGFDLPGRLADVDRVVVLGMGGSAIGGDLVAALSLADARVPVLVHRGYELPGYVDKRTLVIASSYSGNTEETLSCFEQSLKSGAPALAVTTGGRLRGLAEQHDVPAFVYAYKSPPRAALPYSFAAILCFLQRLKLIHERTMDVAQAAASLRALAGTINETVPLAANEAKQLARDVCGRLVIIYGAETLSEVAHRWKTQINENSKTWAFHETIPELNHNAVVGYEFPHSLRKSIRVIMLASSRASSAVARRYEITGRLLQDAGVEVSVIRGEGNSRLAEMMNLVLLGDYISYYLALLNGSAPGPVAAIDYLKAELAKGAGR